jgi:hypothetical protein
MHALVIPDSSSWFTDVFGPRNGPVLDFQYRSQLGYQFSRLYAYLPLYARGTQRLIDAEHSEPDHLSPFIDDTDADLIRFATSPLRIYRASIATSREGPWLKVGSFVYVKGDFRYLGTPSMTRNWQASYHFYDKPFEP